MVVKDAHIVRLTGDNIDIYTLDSSKITFDPLQIGLEKVVSTISTKWPLFENT